MTGVQTCALPISSGSGHCRTSAPWRFVSSHVAFPRGRHFGTVHPGHARVFFTVISSRIAPASRESDQDYETSPGQHPPWLHTLVLPPISCDTPVLPRYLAPGYPLPLASPGTGTPSGSYRVDPTLQDKGNDNSKAWLQCADVTIVQPE